MKAVGEEPNAGASGSMARFCNSAIYMAEQSAYLDMGKPRRFYAL